MAGYLATDLRQDQPGTLTLICIASDAACKDMVAVDLYYGGATTGIRLPSTSPADGVFQFQALDLRIDAPTQFLLELQASVAGIQSALWPYLDVR